VACDFKNILKGKNPSQLLRIYTSFTLFSTIGIIFLAYFGICQIYLKEHIKEAEHDAIGISHLIFQQDTEMLFTSVSKGEKIFYVSPKDFGRIDELMVSFLRPLNIVKIKIFSKDRKIVYSTDHKIIGQIDSGNSKLNRALGGEVVSIMEKKDKVWDIAGEQRFDIDLVESYVPVKDEKGKIIGSFELYLDISRHQDSLRRVLKMSLIFASIFIFIVFGVFYVFFRKSMSEWSISQK
jgi:hypothetical protein